MSAISGILKTLSGGMTEKLSQQLLFDKVIGFRGVKDGVGCSTFVFNTVCGLRDTTKYNICVVDTNMIYPTQEFLLGISSSNDKEVKDFLDFSGDNVSSVAQRTRYSNVYLVSFRDRLLPDMLSSKECRATVEKLFETLKAFFDIIIVDISHEPTWASTVSALKCNKIYTILEPSLTCMSILQKSLNSLASVGVPVYKLRKIILNKNIADVNTGVYKSLKNLGLEVFADVPFSVDIARYGLIGDRTWGAMSNREAVSRFNQAVDLLLDDICQSNETNAVYIKNESEMGLEGLVKENPEDNPDIFEGMGSMDEADVYSDAPAMTPQNVSSAPQRPTAVAPPSAQLQKAQEQPVEKRGLFGKKVSRQAPQQAPSIGIAPPQPAPQAAPTVSRQPVRRPPQQAPAQGQPIQRQPGSAPAMARQPMPQSNMQRTQSSIPAPSQMADDDFDLFSGEE